MLLNTAGVLRDSEHTLHPADNTTGNTANRATYGPADRTGGTIADGGPVFGAAYNSLRLNGSRDGKNGEADRGKQNACFHWVCSSLEKSNPMDRVGSLSSFHSREWKE